MPHVVVKLWPGRSEEQKTRLAKRIADDVMSVLDCGEESVSVAMEEVKPEDWLKEVFEPEIKRRWSHLYKTPDYDESDLSRG